jgi:hypothetical protein
MDQFFRENHDILVYKDKYAISPHRPAAYTEREQDEVRRASSVDPRMLRQAVNRHVNGTGYGNGNAQGMNGVNGDVHMANGKNEDVMLTDRV